MNVKFKKEPDSDETICKDVYSDFILNCFINELFKLKNKSLSQSLKIFFLVAIFSVINLVFMLNIHNFSTLIAAVTVLLIDIALLPKLGGILYQKRESTTCHIIKKNMEITEIIKQSLVREYQGQLK